MQDQLTKLSTAIEYEDLPHRFKELFSDCIDDEGKRFTIQETFLIDFKEKLPEADDKDYRSGLIKLIVSFHNAYGGLIVFGVRNSDFRIVGCEGVLDIELYNNLIRDLFDIDCELIRKDYTVDGTQPSNITVLLVPKRKNKAPAEALRDYHRIHAGEIYVRDRHEALRASDRHLPFLYSGRMFNSETSSSLVHVSLPPSPATLPRYIGRFDLMKQIWDWFRYGRNPRLYLSGAGGSGKSTLAYEFAERVASPNFDVRCANGEKIDYVLYLSAKETELNVWTGEQRTYQLRHFSNANEQIGAILQLSGLYSPTELMEVSYEKRLEAIDHLFDNFNGLIVIDDIDALTRAGIDTGEEDLFLKASRARRSTKILYTLRNDASYAKNFSIPVPGLNHQTELPQFIDACCRLFDVPPPTADQESAIIAESSALPLLVETIVGLRRNSSSYEQALRDFKEKGGDEARRYLYQREYDRLSPKGKSRQVLATLMAFNGPLGFDALTTLTSSNPEQTRFAISETANIFLKIGADALGSTVYSLTPSAQAFIRTASGGLPYIEAVKRAVVHFRTNSAKTTPHEATVLLRMETLIKSRRFDEAVSFDREISSDDPVRVSPRYMAALGRAFAQCETPDLTRARELFSSAYNYGWKDVFMMRSWYHVERVSGYRYEEAASICRAVLGCDRVSDRHRSEFYSKLGECLALQARDGHGEGPERTSVLLCDSVVAYLKALWVGRDLEELDASKALDWLQRASTSFFREFNGDMGPMVRSLDAFFREGFGADRESVTAVLSPLNYYLRVSDTRFLRRLRATLAVGITAFSKLGKGKEIVGCEEMVGQCVNFQKRVDFRLMELEPR